MGNWKRLAAAFILTASVLVLLSACSNQSLDAIAGPGNSPATAGTSAVQSEAFASNGETDAGSPSPSAPGTAAPPEMSEQPGGSDASSSSSLSANAPDELSPAADARQDDNAQTGTGTDGAGSSTSHGSSHAQVPPSSVSPDSQDAQSHTVTLSITGNAEWGTVLPLTEIEWSKDVTVQKILIPTLKKHKLAYETRGAGALFYVTGIDGLFEFDDGPLSGWKYRVNGEVVGISAGVYKLEPGDRVEWFYTTDDNEEEPSIP